MHHGTKGQTECQYCRRYCTNKNGGDQNPAFSFPALIDFLVPLLPKHLKRSVPTHLPGIIKETGFFQKKLGRANYVPWCDSEIRPKENRLYLPFTQTSIPTIISHGGTKTQNCSFSPPILLERDFGDASHIYSLWCLLLMIYGCYATKTQNRCSRSTPSHHRSRNRASEDLCR